MHVPSQGHYGFHSYHMITTTPRWHINVVKTIITLIEILHHTLTIYDIRNKGNNKITELRTILQRESQVRTSFMATTAQKWSFMYNSYRINVSCFLNMTISQKGADKVCVSALAPCILHHTLTIYDIRNKGNNKITELRTILQRESQNS
jgi:hypothetical protein